MSFHKLPTKHIDQLSLNVTDLDRSISFYEQILGFKVLTKKEDVAVLTVNGKTPILTLVVPENVAPIDHRKTGLFHVAYLLPSRKDLGDFLYFLLANRLPIQGASDHGVSEAIYLADPDGNGIEVYRDRTPEEWSWNRDRVDMVTEELKAEEILSEKSDEGWKGCPEDTVIGHIHLKVHDLNPIKDFYVDLLSIDIVAEYGPQALFIADNKYHHHIGLNIWQSRGGAKKPDNEVGLNWYSIKMTKEDRQVVKNKLEEASFSIDEEDGSYVVEDPAGIKIHF